MPHGLGDENPFNHCPRLCSNHNFALLQMVRMQRSNPQFAQFLLQIEAKTLK